jgi:hypothetical protein
VTADPGRPAPPDIWQQREEVAAQREELGRTIAELADRVDVSARAREQTARVKARLRSAKPGPVLGAIAIGCAAVSAVAFASWRRRPRSF